MSKSMLELKVKQNGEFNRVNRAQNRVHSELLFRSILVTQVMHTLTHTHIYIIYINIYTYIYIIYIYMYIYICTYKHLHSCARTYIYTGTCKYTRTSQFVQSQLHPRTSPSSPQA